MSNLYLKAIFAVFTTLALFGGIIPTLISQDSDFSVFFGMLLVMVYPAFITKLFYTELKGFFGNEG